MNACRFSSAIDHYLVARAQSRATGANAHDLHALLSTYFGLVELTDSDPTDSICRHRLDSVESRLRAFCLTGELRRPA